VLLVMASLLCGVSPSRDRGATAAAGISRSKGLWRIAFFLFGQSGCRWSSGGQSRSASVPGLVLIVAFVLPVGVNSARASPPWRGAPVQPTEQVSPTRRMADEFW
jgi:hypothetical protein